MQFLNARERTAIEDAIVRVERKTSGEIVAVVTSASARYFAIGLMWVALVALIVPLPLIWFTDWSVEQIYLAQLAVFAVGIALIQWTPFRLALVPKAVKRARAHKRAVEEFLAQNLHTTKDRTGMLIYVSFAEHFVGLIADNGIDKKVPRQTWEQVVHDLTDQLRRGAREKGLVNAIEVCGKLLAEHFPARSYDVNELPNHLIVRDLP